MLGKVAAAVASMGAAVALAVTPPAVAAEGRSALEDQDAVAGVLEQVEAGHPGAFAGAEFDSAGTVVLAFKGEVPAGVKESVAKITDDVRYVTGTGYTAGEMEDAVAAAADRVEAEAPGAGFRVSPDGVSGEISVAVDDSSGVVSGGALAEVEDAVTDVVDSEVSGVETSIVSEDLSEEQTTALPVYGGGHLGGRCTKAFTARRTYTLNGKTYREHGVLTAGHCVTLRHTGLQARATVFGNKGDASFFRVLPGYVVKPYFWYTPGKAMQVKQKGSVYAGMAVCKNGKNSGYACSRVLSTGNAMYYSEDRKTVHHMAYTTGRMGVLAGDSGAPMFYGSTALGILSGAGSSSAYFQPIRGVESVLNVRVLVG